VVGDPDVVAVGFGYFHSQFPEVFAEAGEELCGGLVVGHDGDASGVRPHTVSLRQGGQGALGGTSEEYRVFRWPCGQRFPAEEAVLRRLACSSVPRQPTIEANGIVDMTAGPVPSP
jgi:hypothetical protein